MSRAMDRLSVIVGNADIWKQAQELPVGYDCKVIWLSRRGQGSWIQVPLYSTGRQKEMISDNKSYLSWVDFPAANTEGLTFSFPMFPRRGCHLSGVCAGTCSCSFDEQNK